MRPISDWTRRSSTHASTRASSRRTSTPTSTRPSCSASRERRISSSTADPSAARSRSKASKKSSTRSWRANSRLLTRTIGIRVATLPGMPITDALSAQLDRLAAFEAGPFPVVSLYLNAQSDQHGRDHFEPFLRKELPERLRTYPAEGPERKSLEEDAEKINSYLGNLTPSANGIVIFASSGAGLFEAIELAAPIDQHRLYVSDEPHLYPLARVLDQYPRYAVLLADTHRSRIVVVAANAVEATEQVTGTKTRRHKMGGWSQARYQRHIENY